MVTKEVSTKLVNFMSASFLGSRYTPKDEDRDAIEAYSLSTLLKDESENIRPYMFPYKYQLMLLLFA